MLADQPGSPAAPQIPAGILHVWSKLVLAQAAQGRRNVALLVPVMLEILVERSIQQHAVDPMKPGQAKKALDRSMQEVARIAQAQAAAGTGPALAQPFAPLPPSALALDPPQLAHPPPQISSVASLLAYQQQVLDIARGHGELLRTLATLQQAVTSERMRAAQRFASWAPALLEHGEQQLADFLQQHPVTGSGSSAAAEPLLDLPKVTYKQVAQTAMRRLNALAQPLRQWQPVEKWVRRWRPVAQLLAPQPESEAEPKPPRR